MTRPIKFRSYDKASKKWYYIIFSGRKIEFGGGIPSSETVNWVRGNRITDWEQFTGLTDKNGKEIHEGDIVRVKDYPADPGGYENYKVIFEDGQFKREETNNTVNTALFYCLPDAEVIGNIHENPELLNADNCGGVK